MKKWNKILSDYIGFSIVRVSASGMTKTPMNLLDSMYQQKLWKQTDNKIYKSMSYYYTNELVEYDENAEINKSISNLQK